jgi:hypothetical protein
MCEKVKTQGCILEITVALSRIEEGRSQEGLLVHFGGKLSYLEPEGCTGIQKVGMVDDSKFTILLQGQKSACAGAVSDEGMDLAQEIAMGTPGGEWDGDAWFFTCAGVLEIPWVLSGAEVDYPASARSAVKKANEFFAEFRNEMINLDQQLNENYQQYKLEEN